MTLEDVKKYIIKQIFYDDILRFSLAMHEQISDKLNEHAREGEILCYFTRANASPFVIGISNTSITIYGLMDLMSFEKEIDRKNVIYQLPIHIDNQNDTAICDIISRVLINILRCMIREVIYEPVQNLPYLCDNIIDYTVDMEYNPLSYFYDKVVIACCSAACVTVPKNISMTYNPTNKTIYRIYDFIFDDYAIYVRVANKQIGMHAVKLHKIARTSSPLQTKNVSYKSIYNFHKRDASYNEIIEVIKKFLDKIEEKEKKHEEEAQQKRINEITIR